MKKIVLLVISLICLFIFEYISYANNIARAYLYVNKDTIEKDEEIEITVMLENSKTASFEIYIYFDNTKFEYLSGPENVNIIGNKIIYVWYDETGGNNPKDGEISKFKFKSKQVGNAKFSIEGEFCDSTGKIIDTDFQDIQVFVNETEEETGDITYEEEIEYLKSNNTNLEILAIENALINPAFDTNVTNYDVEVSNETKYLNIFAVSENENAKVEIVGNEGLKEGENLIKITVTAEDGASKKIYQINAKKRNQEEEIIYEEEQKENKEKLETIYQAEKISKDIEIKNDDIINYSQNENSNQIRLLSVLGIMLIWVFVMAVLILKRRKSL